MASAKKSVKARNSKVQKISARKKDIRGTNLEFARLERKAQKLRKHIKIAKEDKQSLVRLKQIENQIAS